MTSKTPEEVAREIVKKYVGPFIALGHANSLYSDVCGDAKKAIAQAIKDAVAEKDEGMRALTDLTNSYCCDIDNLEHKIKSLETKLSKIRGMCGHPDASQACRNILKEIRGQA